MRQEDNRASLILPGDVILGRRDVVDEIPYGRVWYNGRWLPISLGADAAFLVLSVDWDLDDEVELDMVSLETGDGKKMLFAIEANALSTKLTVVRGRECR